MIRLFNNKKIWQLEACFRVFKNHSTLEYHKKCILESDSLLNMIINSTKSIKKQIDLRKAREVMENRKNIVLIINAIFLFGPQNLALRGYRDLGKIVACWDS